MRNFLTLSIAATTLVLATLPSASFADDGDWAMCENAGWSESNGFDSLLVADANMATYGEGAGSTCETMGSDFASAQTLACELTVTGNGKRWGVSAEGSDALTSLNCG